MYNHFCFFTSINFLQFALRFANFLSHKYSSFISCITLFSSSFQLHLLQFPHRFVQYFPPCLGILFFFNSIRFSSVSHRFVHFFLFSYASLLYSFVSFSFNAYLFYFIRSFLSLLIHIYFLSIVHFFPFSHISLLHFIILFLSLLTHISIFFHSSISFPSHPYLLYFYLATIKRHVKLGY